MPKYDTFKNIKSLFNNYLIETVIFTDLFRIIHINSHQEPSKTNHD